MKQTQVCITLLGLATLYPSIITAGIVTLDFDGLKDLESVNQYYNGGYGSLGSGVGPSIGVSVNSGIAVIARSLGGSGVFDSSPSSPAALFADALTTVMVTGGFSDTLAFYYLAPISAVTVRIFNSGGDQLLVTNLSPTPPQSPGDPSGLFVPVDLAFSGLAASFVFAARGLGGVYLDNIQLNVDSPVGVDEPSSSMWIGSLCVVYLLHRAKALAGLWPLGS